jgi:hypothetical protein
MQHKNYHERLTYFFPDDKVVVGTSMNGVIASILWKINDGAVVLEWQKHFRGIVEPKITKDYVLALISINNVSHGTSESLNQCIAILSMYGYQEKMQVVDDRLQRTKSSPAPKLIVSTPPAQLAFIVSAKLNLCDVSSNSSM